MHLPLQDALAVCHFSEALAMRARLPPPKQRRWRIRHLTNCGQFARVARCVRPTRVQVPPRLCFIG